MEGCGQKVTEMKDRKMWSYFRNLKFLESRINKTWGFSNVAVLPLPKMLSNHAKYSDGTPKVL